MRISDSLRDHGLENAIVFVLDPMNNVILQRNNAGSYQAGGKLTTDKYTKVADHASHMMGTETLPSKTEPYEPAEIVGFSPVLPPPRNGTARHGYVTLIVVPKTSAFQTIYDNQFRTLAILGVSFVLTIMLGWLFGSWFIRPLLEIKDVTEDLHEGHLYNRTHINRNDELGDLASLTNSVVDRLSEVIGQIRDGHLFGVDGQQSAQFERPATGTRSRRAGGHSPGDRQQPPERRCLGGPKCPARQGHGPDRQRSQQPGGTGR